MGTAPVPAQELCSELGLVVWVGGGQEAFRSSSLCPRALQSLDQLGGIGVYTGLSRGQSEMSPGHPGGGVLG